MTNTKRLLEQGNMGLIAGLLTGVVILGGIIYFAIDQNQAATESAMEPETEMMEETGVMEEEMMGNESMPTEEMMDDEGMNSDGMEKGAYIPYSEAAFAEALGRKRVYFFHANWCPTCKVAHEEFEVRTDQIPDDVVVFKTDYDTERELKQRYEITYQHTFVQVDENGDDVAKWNGGGVEELIENVI